VRRARGAVVREQTGKSIVRRALLAEFVGTFGIVFAPVMLSAVGKETSLLSAALVSGLVVTAMIVAFGEASGAHFNPAVTLALAVNKAFSWKQVVPYVIAQLLGGIAAAGLAFLLFGVASGTHVPSVAPLQAVAIEAILTLFLMLTIYGLNSETRTGSALVVGMIVIVDVLLGGPVTGGSMNPARSLGPALFAGGAALANYYIYLIGPVLGALIATGIRRMFSPKTESNPL
jgi:MIP family channel proteins